MSTINVKSLNNTLNIDKYFTTIENITIYSKNKNPNGCTNRKRNWDSSSDEEQPIVQTKMARVNDSSSDQDKPIRKVINFLKRSRKNKNKSYQIPIIKNCYSEEYLKKHNSTQPEINSEPITENEKLLANNSNSLHNFLKQFSQNKLIENEHCSKTINKTKSTTQDQKNGVLTLPLTHFFKQTKNIQCMKNEKNKIYHREYKRKRTEAQTEKDKNMTTKGKSIDNFLNEITQKNIENENFTTVINSKELPIVPSITTICRQLATRNNSLDNFLKKITQKFTHSESLSVPNKEIQYQGEKIIIHTKSNPLTCFQIKSQKTTEGISNNNKPQDEFTETSTASLKENALNMENISQITELPNSKSFEDVLKSLKSMKSENDHFKIHGKTKSNTDLSKKIEHKSIINDNFNNISQDEGRINLNMSKTESSYIFSFSSSEDNGTEIPKTQSSNIVPNKKNELIDNPINVANSEISQNNQLSERNCCKNSDEECIERNMTKKLCSDTSYQEEFRNNTCAHSSNKNFQTIILNEFEEIKNKSINVENNKGGYKNYTKLKTTNNLTKNPILKMIHSHNYKVISDEYVDEVSSKIIKDFTPIFSNLNNDGGKPVKSVHKNVRETTEKKKFSSENNCTQNQSDEDNKSDKSNTDQIKKPWNNLLNNELKLILMGEYEKCTKLQEKYSIINDDKITRISDSNSKVVDRNNLNDSTLHQLEEDDICSNPNVVDNKFDIIIEKNGSHKSSTNQTKTSCNNLLNDEQLNLILTEEYEKSKKREEKYGKSQDVTKTRITKLIKYSKMKNEHTNKMCLLKRYRKGKLKIYRLKKAKKPCTSPPPKEDLNIESVLEGLTQNFIEPDSKFNRSKSYSSVSTSSSYVTDETRSETMSTSSRDLTLPEHKLRTGLNNLLKDKTMVCKEEERFFSEYDKSEIKRKIQDIFLQVFDDLTKGRRSVLKFRRQCLANCTFKDGRLRFKSEDPAMTLINSNAQNSQNKFKLILYILKKVQTLLETNTKLTKRELFYQLKDMISNQSVIDRAINAVSCLLDVGMWALNIVAQKGLVYGDLKIVLSSGETINCKIPGTLIPQDIEEIIEIQSIAYFILVVEKESIFHKLIEENLPSKLTRPFIMITGKGFPDLNTQLFLRKLWIVMSIPVFILVDADPDGIQIMLNYRFGSVNNAHVSHLLAVPNAKWLGMYPSDIKDFDVTTQPLTSRELKLVQSLLKTPHVVKNPAIASELKVMYEHQYKAGIEAVMKSMIFLSEVYLPRKFYLHNFI